jgi:4-amino-4-deoxy-L-arabinose transferase-like glycosyltransferase
MRADAETRRWSTYGLFLVWAALVAVCASVVAASFRTPFEYDEAYNLQIVGHLLSGGGYATDGSLWSGIPRSFDPKITTGPTLMLPVAFFAAIFGEHPWVYRLAPNLAFLGLLAGTSLLGRRLAGRWAAVLAPAAVLLINPSRLLINATNLQGSGDVLGEITACCLLVAAALLIERPRVAGLLVGLALLAKFLCLLAMPGFIVGVLLLGNRAAARRGVLLFLAGAGLPLVCWQVLRFALLGWHDYWIANRDFLDVFLFSGSGVAAGPTQPTLTLKFHQQAELVTPVGVAALALVLALVALALVTRRWSLASRVPREAAGLSALVATGLIIELWWLFISNVAWVRHSMIAVFLLLPTLVTLGFMAARVLPPLGRRFACATLVSATMIAAGWHGITIWGQVGDRYDRQLQVATAIQALPGDEIRFSGWWQNPELTLLTDKQSVELDSSGGLLVIPPEVRGFVPEEWVKVSAMCDRVVLSLNGYVVCQVDAS